MLRTLLLVALMSANSIAADLPAYQFLDMKHPEKHPVLRKKGKKLKFPLSAADKRDVEIISKKFDAETNMAGLAAHQIGIAKQIIVFAAPEDPTLKKWRPDFTQTMPKTIWINPSYEGIGTKKTEDYEACFSVDDMAGQVERFKEIRYKAFDLNGKLIEGKAEGFLARIIQHEVDHVHGKVYVDLVPKDKLLKVSEYREQRRKALEGESVRKHSP